MLRRHLSEIMMYYNFIDDICIIDTKGIIIYNHSFIRDAYSFPVENTIGEHISTVYPSSAEGSSMLKVLKTEKPIINYKTTWKTYNGDSHTGVVNTLPIYEDNRFIGVVEIAKYSEEERPVDAIHLRSGKSSHRLYTLDNINTVDRQIYHLKEQVLKLSKYNCNVMLQGETGTGKELFAQAIHSGSPNSNSPFISQNCSALPDTLAESILFGTEKGGFTGAENKKGLFELADGGTLFLDELNSMSINVQSKILKALEDKRITRVGGETPIDVNVRIISALNCNPIEAVSEGTLRSDLFYRLSTVLLVIPPLRQRENDIEFLSEYFFNYFKVSLNADVDGISCELMDFLKAYSWPGNVRELRNVIQSCIIMSNSRIIEKDALPGYLQNAEKIKELMDETKIQEKGGTLAEKLCNYEKSLIEQALKDGKNKSEAAELLGISRQLLNHKMDKYNLK